MTVDLIVSAILSSAGQRIRWQMADHGLGAMQKGDPAGRGVSRVTTRNWLVSRRRSRQMPARWAWRCPVRSQRHVRCRQLTGPTTRMQPLTVFGGTQRAGHLSRLKTRGIDDP